MNEWMNGMNEYIFLTYFHSTPRIHLQESSKQQQQQVSIDLSEVVVCVSDAGLQGVLLVPRLVLPGVQQVSEEKTSDGWNWPLEDIEFNWHPPPVITCNWSFAQPFFFLLKKKLSSRTPRPSFRGISTMFYILPKSEYLLVVLTLELPVHLQRLLQVILTNQRVSEWLNWPISKWASDLLTNQ